jgi:iron complex transport system substrate-binding protein
MLCAAALAQSVRNLESVRVRLGPQTYPRMAMDSQAGTVVLRTQAMRIVSLASNTDEYLYQIVPPDTVVGVSASAYNETFSAVLPYVNKYRPPVARDIESILKLKPDLVITTDSSPHEPVHALQDAGIPVFRQRTLSTRLDQVADNITVVGYLTGYDERARIERSRFERELAEIAQQCKKPHEPARIYGVSMSGFSYGDETLFHDVVRLVGGVNVSAENGLHTYDQITKDFIARTNPDWVFAWSAPGPGKREEELRRWMDDPVLSKIPAANMNRIIVSDAKDIFVLSPLVTNLAHILADATCKGAR